MIGKLRLLGKTRSVQYLESLSLLKQFHARGHGGFIFLLQQLVVISFGLVIPASQVCQLLFANRLLTETSLVFLDSCFERRDGSVTIGNVDLIGFQLYLNLNL